MATKDLLAVATGRSVKGVAAVRAVDLGDLAERIGIARNSMSRRINGHIPFTWPEMFLVAEALGMEPSEILDAAQREVMRLTVMADTDAETPCDMDGAA